MSYGLAYYGVIRDWTAIFGQGGTFIVLHHFIDKEPMWALYGKDSCIHYHHLSLGDGMVSVLETLNRSGVSHHRP